MVQDNPPSGVAAAVLPSKNNAPAATDGSYVLATDGDGPDQQQQQKRPQTLKYSGLLGESVRKLLVTDADRKGCNIFRSIVSAEIFQRVIFALILLNVAVMGVGTTDLVTKDPDMKYAFEIVEFSFLVVFTAELAFSLASFGTELFRSGWLTFDFVVIIASWFHPTFQVVRGFRALSLLSRIGYVGLLMRALHMVLPVMGSIVVLLLGIFYVAAVIFTDLFGGMYADGTASDRYFDDLGKSFFTLFQVTTGAGWPEIAREIMKTHKYAWIPFVLFVSVTMFVVVELTIAALVESVSKMEQLEMADSAEKSVREGAATAPLLRDDDAGRVMRIEMTIDRMTADTAGPAPRARAVRRQTMSKKSTQTRRGSMLEILAMSFSFDEEEDEVPAADGGGRLRALCAPVATNALFQSVITFSVVINSIMMGLATYDFVKNDASVSSIFYTTDKVFLLIFTFELLVQFGYRGSAFFGSGWLVFDLLVVAVSWFLTKVQVARAFRCFRLFSRVQFMKSIIGALTMVASKLSVVAGLLLIFFYIFGVVFTDLFKDMYSDGLTSQDYFGSLAQTLFTLFQCMTIAGWPDIAREVMITYEWAWIPFVTWIVVSKFTVVQLIIAVLCQSLAHVEAAAAEDADGEGVDPELPPPGVEDGARLARLEAKLGALQRNLDAIAARSELGPTPVSGTLA